VGRLERGSRRLHGSASTIFAESARLVELHRGIDLGVGAPDFECPDAVKQIAIAAIHDGRNQYSPIPGTPELRRAVADHAARFRNMTVDPDSMILITSGATEGVLCALLALIDPGDEVVVFEPFYDTYPAQIAFAGGVMRTVALYSPDDAHPGWWFDPDQLASAFGPRTRLVLLNTPHNPTGKVFTTAELQAIAALCVSHDVIALCDEVYEHIIYPGSGHVSLASLPEMAERTITVSSGGKTFNATGWKVGWAIAAPGLRELLLHTHQYVTATVPAPFQAAIAAGLALPDRYFEDLALGYARRRRCLHDALAAVALQAPATQGTYFLLVDVHAAGFASDREFCRFFHERIGIATIPCSAFFTPERAGNARWARLAFCKPDRNLDAAADRLLRLGAPGATP
jgi:N-succinyldiaminopimelate aminotransferase